jgi:mono/diheme cytochrome c family protein
MFPAMVALTVLLLPPLHSQTANTRGGRSGSQKPNEALIARGKYIVEDVAMCGQCHTPRDNQGQPDRSKWLDGAALWLQPASPVQDWPLKAPRIGGNPPGTDAEMVKLLTTGIWKFGQPLRPPMPQFRMTQEDAEAVVAYLKSLAPSLQ